MAASCHLHATSRKKSLLNDHTNQITHSPLATTGKKERRPARKKTQENNAKKKQQKEKKKKITRRKRRLPAVRSSLSRARLGKGQRGAPSEQDNACHATFFRLTRVDEAQIGARVQQCTAHDANKALAREAKTIKQSFYATPRTSATAAALSLEKDNQMRELRQIQCTYKYTPC